MSVLVVVSRAGAERRGYPKRASPACEPARARFVALTGSSAGAQASVRSGCRRRAGALPLDSARLTTVIRPQPLTPARLPACYRTTRL